MCLVLVTPEEKARQNIDRQLEECGWLVQHPHEMNIMAGLGVAVREFKLKSGSADATGTDVKRVSGKALAAGLVNVLLDRDATNPLASAMRLTLFCDLKLNPATLRRLIVDLIDTENWSSMQADVKGDLYEGLLAKSAAEDPKGAGQYFTPRELIKAIARFSTKNNFACNQIGCFHEE